LLKEVEERDPSDKPRDNILAVPITDTSSSAQAVQLQLQRSMSGEQRLLLAFEMSMFARVLSGERIRRERPGWTESQVARELIRLAFLPGSMPEWLRRAYWKQSGGLQQRSLPITNPAEVRGWSS
jgi:hypothetical protein